MKKLLLVGCLLLVSINSFANESVLKRIVGPQKTICGIENVRFSFAVTLDDEDPTPNPLLMKEEYFSYGATSVKTCDYTDDGDNGIAVVAVLKDGRVFGTIFSSDLID